MNDLLDKIDSDHDIKNSYDATSIEVLEGLEPVRKRPGMYIGGVDINALHHLIAEVFDNSMDEVVAGYAKSLAVSLDDENTITISDNGRGIPIDEHPKFPGKSALEVIFTTLHSGGKFNNKTYLTSGGLHGVGISVVNALSKELTVTITREFQTWQQSYQRGKVVSELKFIGKSKSKSGTKITFTPDDKIFAPEIKFNAQRIYKFIKSKAYLYKGIKINWQSYQQFDDVPQNKEICYPNGIDDLLAELCPKDEMLIPNCFTGQEKFTNLIGNMQWAIALA